MTEEKKSMSKGCVIGLAIAGGLLLLIMIVLGVVYFYRNDIRDKALDMVEERIVQAEPEGYSEAQISRIFELYILAIDSGSVGPKEGEKAALIFQEIFADDEVTSEEALRMLTAIREITDEMDDSSLPPLEHDAESDAETDSVSSADE